MLRVSLIIGFLLGASASAPAQVGSMAEQLWPKTKFSEAGLDAAALILPGQRKSPGSLNRPQFLPLDLAGFVGGLEPVIAVSSRAGVKAYPLRIVIAHGVINDRIGDVPVAVSYCQSCSGAVLMRREINGNELVLADSGVTYKGMRLLYDHQTESWWQESDGKALAGTYRNTVLPMLPAQVIAMSQFRRLYNGRDDAHVLAETDRSRVTSNQKLDLPVPIESDLAPGVDPRDEVPILNEQSWTLELLAQERRLGRESPIILTDPPKPKPQP